MRIPLFVEKKLKGYLAYAIICIFLAFIFFIIKEKGVSIVCLLLAAYIGVTIYDIQNYFSKKNCRIFVGKCDALIDEGAYVLKKKIRNREFRFQLKEVQGQNESIILELKENQKLQFIEGESYNMMFKGSGEPVQTSLVICERIKGNELKEEKN